MINTPDLVSTLRALYIQNSGAIPADKLFPLLEETHLQMVDMENLFASIISDLSPKQHWVLPYREVNRFLLLQKAIESKESSSVCQEVLPHLHVLKENLNSPDPNCELSMKAAREVRKDILPFAEKLPKLVKALNDYALLCEKYFSDATLLKRLVANIRLLPLADEANKLVEKRAMLFTIDVYWSTAEELYENSLFLFDDHPFNFSVVRAYLDEAVAVNKVPPLEIAVPASLSLPVVLPEEVPEEPVAIEEPVEIAEDPITVVEPPVVVIPEAPITVVEPPVATASDIVPEKNSPAIEEPITLAKEPMTTVLPEESASLQQPASSQQPRMDAKSDRVPPPARLRKQIIIISTCLMAIIVLGGGIFFFFKNQNAPEERSLSTPVVQELIRDTTRLAAPSPDDTRSTSEKAQPTESPNNRVNSAGKSQEMKNLPAKEEMKLGQKAVELKGSDPKTTAPKSADSKSSDPKMADSKTVEPKAANPKAADPQNVKPESSEASKKPELSKDKETPTTPATNVSSAAFDALLTKAKGGNAAAQYQVGQCYEKGTGVKADLFEALTWYRKAKVNGSEPATQRLMELGY